MNVFFQYFRVNISEKSQIFKICMKKSQNMYLLHNSVYYCMNSAAGVLTFQRARLVCAVIATGNYNDIKTGSSVSVVIGDCHT